jgi:pilus assembly protein CpaF
MLDDTPESAKAPVSAAVRFQKIKTEVHRQIVETLDISRIAKWKKDRVHREVQKLALEMLPTYHEKLNREEQERLVEELMDEVFGLGPLEKLMNDRFISDILVNGPHEVYVERNGRLVPSDVTFADEAHLRQVISRIAAFAGRRTDEMSPMVDARWKDGSRINAILRPLSLNGPVLSIRRFGVRLTGADLLGNATMPPEMFQLLKAAVEARINILISGGTGSGKTTLLNALTQFVPRGERLLTIEDSAELKLAHQHVIRLETRPANAEGIGEINQRDLVRNSLRMRPDRIIIGEVRGGEAIDMLQAMNTGHEGSLTTIHANNTRDALWRLETMVSLAGLGLHIEAIRYYIASAITLVVQLNRLRGGPRKIVRISEITGTDPGPYNVKDIFGFRQTGIEDDCAVGHFYTTGYRPQFLEILEANGIHLPEGMFEARTLEASKEVIEGLVIDEDEVADWDTSFGEANS